MWQLRCTLHWTPSAETEPLESKVRWSFGMPLDDFFAEALALPGWAWTLTGVPVPALDTSRLNSIRSERTFSERARTGPWARPSGA